MAGFIKIHRELLEDKIWSAMTEAQRGAWIGFLLQVNWTDNEWACPKCKRIIHIPPGGTVKTYRNLAKDCETSVKIMKTMLANMLRLKFISRSSFYRCHALYVVNNWDEYQSVDPTRTQHGTQDGPNTGPIYKNIRKKEYKNINSESQNSNLISEQKEEQNIKSPESHCLCNAPEPPLPLPPPITTTTTGRQLAVQEIVIPTEAWQLAKRHRELVLASDPQNTCGTKRWSQKKWAKQYAEFFESFPPENAINWNFLEELLDYAMSKSAADKKWRKYCDTPSGYFKCIDSIRKDKSESKSKKSGTGLNWFVNGEYLSGEELNKKIEETNDE